MKMRRQRERESEQGIWKTSEGGENSVVARLTSLLFSMQHWLRNLLASYSARYKMLVYKKPLHTTYIIIPQFQLESLEKWWPDGTSSTTAPRDQATDLQHNCTQSGLISGCSCTGGPWPDPGLWPDLGPGQVQLEVVQLEVRGLISGCSCAIMCWRSQNLCT